mgnify:FL=1
MKNENGFSLVELLIAITLLAIGLLAVAGMQSTAISSNAWANRLSTATSLAQEVMEDILAKDATDAIFSSSTSNVTYDLTGPNTTGNNISISGAGTFSATRTITINSSCSTPTVTVTGVVKIDVSVTDGTRTVTLTSCKRVT